MSEKWIVGAQFSAHLVEGLTRSQIVQYAGASGDFNPIHTDEVYATEVAGLPGVFGHGMLTMGMCGAFVQSLVTPPALRRFGVRFMEKVWPGDSLEAEATVVAVDRLADGTEIEMRIVVRNQDEVVVLTGSASAVLPQRAAGINNTERTENSHA